MINKTEKEIIGYWKGDINKTVVSICCITFNHKEVIEDALDGFLMQITEYSFNIFVGDDCSTDGTREILNKYITKYPNIIQLVTSEGNVGIQNNSLRTMKACTGEFIALCDGDDYWIDNSKLQIQINEMESNKEYSISFHPSFMQLSDNSIKSNDFSYKKHYSVSEIINSEFHLVPTNSIIFKKYVVNMLNDHLFLESPVNDVWIRVMASIPNGALFINKAMSIYRVQLSGSWTNRMSSGENIVIFVENMFISICEYDRILDNKYHKDFLKYKQRLFKSVISNSQVSIEKRNRFINKYRYHGKFMDIILWYTIYSHPEIYHLLKSIKNRITTIW